MVFFCSEDIIINMIAGDMPTLLVICATSHA
jgi:hypothetical protein